MSDSPWVRDATEASFEADVLVASDTVPVIVDFWAEWCGPCRALGPLLERLVDERKGKVLLVKINTEEAPRLASYFRIESIPAVKVFYKRALVNEFEGLLPEATLRQFLDQITTPGMPSPLAEAHEAEATAPEKAEAIYRKTMADDPDNLEARVGLARVLLAQNKLDEIAEILEPVGPSGEFGTEAESLLARMQLQSEAAGLPDEPTLTQQLQQNPENARAHLDLGIRQAALGKYEEALGMLLAAGERDQALLQGKVREIMVKIFYILGAAHPVSNSYRTRLSRLLY